MPVFLARIFGILRIMLDRVEKIRHEFCEILMEYFSKIVLLFWLPNGADSGGKKREMDGTGSCLS